jgi:hypothetical protein
VFVFLVAFAGVGARFDFEFYRHISFLGLLAYCLMKLLLGCVRRCSSESYWAPLVVAFLDVFRGGVQWR